MHFIYAHDTFNYNSINIISYQFMCYVMPRQRVSLLWSYFTILNNEKCIARCHICQKLFSFKTTTTNLKRHVERKHPNEDCTSLNHEEREHSSANENEFEVSENDWKHLTDHEYMQKMNSGPDKEHVQEEGEVELEFLQDITAADVTGHEQVEHEQQNITELKSVSAPNPVKKYLKIKKLPFRLNRHPRYTGTAYRVRNLDTSVRSNSTPPKPANTDYDEYECFGRHVAAQLRQLPLHNCLLVQESIQSLITRERISSLGVQDSLSDGVTYEEVQVNE